jgi:hypothetical protein
MPIRLVVRCIAQPQTFTVKAVARTISRNSNSTVFWIGDQKLPGAVGKQRGHKRTPKGTPGHIDLNHSPNRE